MKIEAILEYYIYNGNLVSTKNFEKFDKTTDPSIYEVIRVIDEVPLFEEEHIERMQKSARLLGYSIDKSYNDISNEIKELIRVNDCKNSNIKLVCSNLDKEQQTFLVYFIKSRYPKKDHYLNGIHTLLFYSERENPNIKIMNADLRKKANEKIKAEGAYEALLVNEDGYITEGSRSNIFFTKGNEIYTAPPGEVLVGITRNKILDACTNLGVNIVEEHVHVDKLGEFDGVFMTGTSVGGLPISTINNKKYDSVNNKLILKIRDIYDQVVRNYLNLRKLHN